MVGTPVSGTRSFLGGTKISGARFPIPWPGQGYPPSSQDRGTTLARIEIPLQTGYAAGGTPFGFTQEDCLVDKISLKRRSYILHLQSWQYWQLHKFFEVAKFFTHIDLRLKEKDMMVLYPSICSDPTVILMLSRYYWYLRYALPGNGSIELSRFLSL